MKKLQIFLMMSLMLVCSACEPKYKACKPSVMCMTLTDAPKLNDEEKKQTPRKIKEFLLQYKDTKHAWCDYAD